MRASTTDDNAVYEQSDKRMCQLINIRGTSIRDRNRKGEESMRKRILRGTQRTGAGRIAAAAAALILSMSLPSFGTDLAQQSLQSEIPGTDHSYSLAGAMAGETGGSGVSCPENMTSEGTRPSGLESSSGQIRTALKEQVPEETIPSGGGSSSEGGEETGGAPSSGGGREEGGGSSEGGQETGGGHSDEGREEGGASSEGGRTPGSEPSSENSSEPGSEPSSENSSEPHSEPSSESEKPTWPQGYYVVRVTDIAAVIPEGGRVYDGTDRIDLTFQAQISRIPEQTKRKGDKNGQEEENAPEEKIPEYHVEYSAHLESADAGERKVVYCFTLQTSCPEHVTMEAAHPDLTVTVKKAVLSIDISNGTKRYGDAADIGHIRFERDPVVRVSGFVKDQAGNEIIPEGFELPLPAVSSSVLDRWSPIYNSEENVLSGTGSAGVREYRNAVILKTDDSGRVTGNPTGNYEFCQNPEDERFHGGTVTIERAPVRRNVSYGIKGEKDAFRIDDNGVVIVRSGTSVRVEPLPGQGYNTGRKFADITGDSSFSFRLEQRAPDGSLQADSRQDTIQCRVDDRAPEAQINLLGESSSGGLLFSASSVSCAVSVPDDTISGLSRVRYRILSGPVSTQTVESAMQGETSALSAASGWKEISQKATVLLSGEGIFAVEVEVTDQVGNVSLQRSLPAVIDATNPGIEITGVEDGSANASAVHIKAQCLDPSYLPGTMKAEMSGDFGGVVPNSSLREEPGGAMLTFEDFPRRKEADAVYHLTVTASDRAGNRTKKQLSFSVNRFGSTYGLSGQTASLLKKYYHIRPFDVTFLETNLDEVGDARVLLRDGESLNELRTGPFLKVDESRTSRGMSQYAYTVPASVFKKDGVYEVMLLTTDRAGNSSDTSAQRLPVRFAIDTAKPEFLVSGIRPEGRYQEKELTAVVEIRDNQALEKAEVYVDSRIISGQKPEKIGNTGEIIKIPLSEKKAWQTVQVYASDKAGNEAWTAEIPVYVSSRDAMDAENYHKNRLSAQQVELIRKQLERLRKILSEKGLFQGRSSPAGTGSVRNLYQAQQMENKRGSAPDAQAVRAHDSRSFAAQSEGRKKPVLLIWISLAVFGSLAGAGVFLYRRWYVL